MTWHSAQRESNAERRGLQRCGKPGQGASRSRGGDSFVPRRRTAHRIGHKIRGLVDSDGRLPSSYADFARAYLLRKFTPREVHREMEAQIARVLHAGVRPTHLDGHQHVHLMPGVFDIALDLVKLIKSVLCAFHTIAQFFHRRLLR